MSRGRVITNLIATVAFAIICLVGLTYFAAGMGLSVPGTGGYKIQAIFASANGLVPQSEVRIAGVRVGHVLDVGSTEDGKTLVTMSIDSNVHIRADARALIRPKSPLGEKFVEIIRQAGSGASYMSSGQTIPESQTGQAVELDDALSNMDPQTRAAMSKSFQELGAALDGRAADVNASIPQLEQTAGNLRPLARIGQDRQKNIDRILTDVNTIMQSLADEHDSLSQIVNSGDQFMGAVAARDQDLAGFVQQLAILFTSLDQVFNGLTPADRASLMKSPPALAAQRRMLSLTGPNVDQLLPEILLGEINYPNDELSVTHRQSAQLAMEWISNFWQREISPAQNDASPHNALRIASSLQISPPGFAGQSGTLTPSAQTASAPVSTAGTSAGSPDIVDFLLAVQP